MKFKCDVMWGSTSGMGTSIYTSTRRINRIPGGQPPHTSDEHRPGYKGKQSAAHSQFKSLTEDSRCGCRSLQHGPFTPLSTDNPLDPKVRPMGTEDYTMFVRSYQDERATRAA